MLGIIPHHPNQPPKCDYQKYLQIFPKGKDCPELRITKFNDGNSCLFKIVQGYVSGREMSSKTLFLNLRGGGPKKMLTEMLLLLLE